MRTIEHYYNMPGQYWATANGAPLPLRQQPLVGVEEVLLRLHLIDSDGEVYMLPNDQTYEAACATGFTNQVLLMRSLNDSFNIASDWSGSDGISIAAGRICVRCNFNTNEMVSEITTKEVEVLPFQIYMMDVSDNAVTDHLTEKIKVQNVFTGTTPTPLPVPVTRGTVDVTEGAESVVVTANVVTNNPVCTLIAPLGDTNNIGISNIQKALDGLSFVVYFTAPVPTTGFRLTYLIVA